MFAGGGWGQSQLLAGKIAASLWRAGWLLLWLNRSWPEEAASYIGS
jgi:hypothetical protein